MAWKGLSPSPCLSASLPFPEHAILLMIGSILLCDMTTYHIFMQGNFVHYGILATSRDTFWHYFHYTSYKHNVTSAREYGENDALWLSQAIKGKYNLCQAEAGSYSLLELSHHEIQNSQPHGNQHQKNHNSGSWFPMRFQPETSNNFASYMNAFWSSSSWLRHSADVRSRNEPSPWSY